MPSLNPNAPDAAASVIAAAIAPPSSPPIALNVVPKSVIPPITWLRKLASNLNKLEVKTGVCCNNPSVKDVNSSVETPNAVAYFC